MAAKQGPNVIFCMPNRTNCILLVSGFSMDTCGTAVWGRREAACAGGTHPDTPCCAGLCCAASSRAFCDRRSASSWEADPAHEWNDRGLK
jgi:hypothetical protein